MDSSNPQQFHHDPHSRTGSGSRDSSNAGAGSEPDLNDSVRVSPSSAGNNQPEPSPLGGRSSESKRKQSSTVGEPREDDDIENANQSTPKKRYEPESSKGKEKGEDTTTSEEETTVFQGIMENYKENGRYPFADMSSARKFFDACIKGRGVYANTQPLDLKTLELLARILEKEIIACCYTNVVSNWGEKDDEDHEYRAEEITLDDHDGVNPNDSENPKCSEDSYEQEIGDDRGDKKGTNQDSGDDFGHTKDTNELKDLTEQESDGESDTKDSKDSSERETDDKSDTEDSTSSLETSDESDTKDPSELSSKNSSEIETDDGSDTKHLSSTGSKGSSETEIDDDHDDKKDSKDSTSFWLERKLMKIIRALMIAIRTILYGR